MAIIEISQQEVKQVVKGLIVLRDRAYSLYHNHKDPDSETAQKNLALYKELDVLRNRISADAFEQSGLKKVIDQLAS